MHGMLARLRSLWRALRPGAAVGSDTEEEFRFHVEQRADDLTAAGVPRVEALRRARLEFGSPVRYIEEGREARGLRPFDDLRIDLRYATRSLAQRPWFTAAAVLTLALGVGVNAAVFSLVSASLLRPLPFDEADRLVVLAQTYAESSRGQRLMRWWSPAHVDALRSRMTTLGELAAYWSTDVNLGGADVIPVRGRMELVSPDYFPVLRVRPAIGRTFRPEEDAAPGSHPVAVISHHLWQRQFAGDAQVVGREVVLNGVPVAIVGVVPAGFRGLSGEADLWIPHAMGPVVDSPGYLSSDQHFLTLIGRLREDVSLAQAEAEMAVAGRDAAAAVRASGKAESLGPGTWGAALVPLNEARRNPAAVRAQLVLLGAAIVVLLIAAVNLSSLMLARSTARARETALRAALGADRFRLVRHGAVEGTLLGIMAGAAGVLLAIWTVGPLVALAPERWGAPRLSVAELTAFADPSVDWRVIAFAALVALAAGLLSGIVPALRATRGDLTRALKTASRGSSIGMGSLRRPTVLSAAAVAQVACALVLLVGAGLLLQGFHRLTSQDPGFEAEGLVTFNLTLPRAQYGPERELPLLERILERVAAVPGVRSAALGCPPFGGCWSATFEREGQPPSDHFTYIRLHSVTPNHFATVGIPVIRGRGFTAQDRDGAPRVAVINETAAMTFWPGEDPLGKRLWLGDQRTENPDAFLEIVGIARDVLYGRPNDEIRPALYRPYLQHGRVPATVTARAAGDPRALVPALQRAVAEVDPALAMHDVGTMQDRVAAGLAPERFATTAVGVFAGLGLFLASLGIYGVMAYSVAQRRREIGIRLALGAAPSQILAVVIGRGAALTIAGLALGTLAAVALAGVLPALIAGLGTADPRVYAGAAALLLSVALGACYVPARAATRVDPVDTLAAD